MSRLTILSLFASSVAAQNLLFVNDAVNTSDLGYQVCSAVNEYLSGCIDQAGGVTSLLKENPVSLASCACCVSNTDVAPLYATCSDYLVASAPTLSLQVTAASYIYQVCEHNPVLCGNGGVPAQTTQNVPASPPTNTPQDNPFAAPTPTPTTSTPLPLTQGGPSTPTDRGAVQTVTVIQQPTSKNAGSRIGLGAAAGLVLLATFAVVF